MAARRCSSYLKAPHSSNDVCHTVSNLEPPCFLLAVEASRVYSFNSAMVKHFSSLILILVLGGTVLAGLPLHHAEDSCSMSGMAMQDCCKMAEGQTTSPEVVAARLFCVINCEQPGTTGAQFTWRAPIFKINSLPIALICSSIHFVHPLLRPTSTAVPRLNQQPSYIRNLALLI